MTQPQINLKPFTFQELFTVQGLQKLDQRFLSELQNLDSGLYESLRDYRAGLITDPITVSNLILTLGPILENFIANLYQIEESLAALRGKTLSHNPIFEFKQFYVLREAKRALRKPDYAEDFTKLDFWLSQELAANGYLNDDPELSTAQYGLTLLEDPEKNAEKIAILIEWCTAALKMLDGHHKVRHWLSFKLPQKLDHENLVPLVPLEDDPLHRVQAPENRHRVRDGFELTDPRMTQREAMNEIHYCVYCHKTDGDFCSKGFPVKKTEPELGLKVNPVGDTLTGCPLEEKISEMHFLKREGFSIASLATVMIDNPMCPATGHRICNDCMKACIYQKQDPVNIPQAETRILTDVLNLPWGVEIYDLLTRWNPLRHEQWLPKPYNGLKVLVMGMGPAGFTLAHHLLMDGFAVVGADGLKLEPLPLEHYLEPIYRFQDLEERLDRRIMAGFGGVAEYGITVRWDKNFLKLIYISLMRRQHFQVVGSVRFGGTLTVSDVWQLGFDHLALAVGAGLPRELRIPGSLAIGMRQANDFLMALQLTGAAKESSFANLQVRMPIAVIGGGLTGIDTATEAQAYYILQVEKVVRRYHKLIEYFGKDFVDQKFQGVDSQILQEFLDHGQQVINERLLAAKELRQPNLNGLIRKWGGVTVLYRRTMQESPAYQRNHEEVINALDEGILYAENLEPVAVILDEFGHAKALRMRGQANCEDLIVPARAIFVATGAKPNIAYEFEHRGTFARDGYEYRRYELIDNQLQQIIAKDHVKTAHFGPFTSYDLKHHKVTFLGDTHPVFHGSVVKAIASAKRTYPSITKALEKHFTMPDGNEYLEFSERIDQAFRAEVISVKSLTEDILELKVKAPIAAKNFGPGQFYRVQNYERNSAVIENTRLQMEALALIGYQFSDEPDYLTFMVQKNGVSSKLVERLAVGEPISVMGPTGALSKVLNDETVLIIGGPMAVAHLLSHGPYLKAANNRIIFVGFFDSAESIIYKEKIEELADEVQFIFSYEELLPALAQFIKAIDRAFVIGNSQLIKTIQNARNTELKSDIEFVASVQGPMQCMLKGVCAQCLQWQIDPKTGERTKAVYACSWQNQPMEMIDIDNLSERLAQNHVQETLANLWLDFITRNVVNSH